MGPWLKTFNFPKIKIIFPKTYILSPQLSCKLLKGVGGAPETSRERLNRGKGSRKYQLVLSRTAQEWPLQGASLTRGQTGVTEGNPCSLSTSGLLAPGCAKVAKQCKATVLGAGVWEEPGVIMKELRWVGKRMGVPKGPPNEASWPEEPARACLGSHV